MESLKVPVLDWKQTIYPDKHLQEFENKEKQHAQISATEGKREEIAVEQPCTTSSPALPPLLL